MNPIHTQKSLNREAGRGQAHLREKAPANTFCELAKARPRTLSHQVTEGQGGAF